MKGKTYSIFFLAPLAVAAGAILCRTSPVHAAAKQVKKAAPVQQSAAAKLAADKAQFMREVSSADTEFLAGHVDSALEAYQKLKGRGSRWQSASLECKISACFAQQRRYSDAMDALRSADKAGGSLSGTGLVKAQMALLAYKYRDRGTLEDLLKETRKAFFGTGGQAKSPTDPQSGLFMDGPGWSTKPDAQVYLLFARNFAVSYQREGTDFAYQMALKVSGNEPSISLEYARNIGAYFEDEEAKMKILQAANSSKDAKLQRKIDIARANATSWFGAATPAQRAAQRQESMGHVRAFKENMFRSTGVF